MSNKFQKFAIVFVIPIVVILFALNFSLKKNDIENIVVSESPDEVVNNTTDELFLKERTIIKLGNNTSMFLSDLYHGSPVLVLRFSEFNCDLCVIAQFNNLKQIADKKEHIILLASYENQRKLKAFLLTHRIDLPAYMIEEGGLDLSIEDLNFPFYFVMNGHLKISNLFLPEKDSPDITLSYLYNLATDGLLN